MFSFEVSAIDIVLLVAVMLLIVLFTTQKKSQVATESRLPLQDEEKLLEKQETRGQTAEKKLEATQLSKGFRECVHHLGYLKNLPQNTSVPDECFGCPKVMRCLFPNEESQLVH